MPDPSSSPSDGSPSPPDLGEMIRFYISIFRRRWRIIGSTCLVFLLIAVAYILLTYRKYEATARVLVLQEGERPLSVSSNDPNRTIDPVDDYIPTHALILSSQAVVGRAVETLGMENLPTLMDLKEKGKHPIEEAASNLLRVDRPDRMAKVIRLFYRAYTVEEAVRTLQAITESYKAYLTENLTKNNNQIVRLIVKARDELESELENLEKKYLEFRQDKHVMLTDEKGRSFATMQLEQVSQAANEAKIKAIQVQAQLELGRKLQLEGRGLWAIAHAMEQVGASQQQAGGLLANLSLTNQSVPLEYLRILTTEQQQLTEKFGPKNARVMEIKELLDRAQEGVRDVRSRLDRGEIQDLLAAVDTSCKSLGTIQAELKKEFEQGLDGAKRAETDLLLDSNLRANLDRQRLLFNTVVEQLKQAQFVNDYSSFTAHIIEVEPNWPLNAAYPRRSIVLAIALVLGGMIGLTWALVVDRLDQRLRTAAEVRKALNLQVIGQIPRFPEERVAAIGGAGLVAEALPRSPWAESYRRARTNLELLRRGRQIQVIQVTSPRPGDGKTTTASNLAISLAHAGRRVLLIDADLRSPSLDRLHGLSRDRGLADALKDAVALPGLVQRTAIENLSVITSGPQAHNPAELLTSPRLGEFLTEVRKDYDFAIIDSSPLLAVADPTILGAAVDGVLLVLGAPAIKRSDAEHALDLLGTLGIPVVGAFLNGSAHEAAGYGYGRDVDLPSPGGEEPAGDQVGTPPGNNGVAAVPHVPDGGH